MAQSLVTVTASETVVNVAVTLGVKGDQGDPGPAGAPATTTTVLTLLGIPTYANLSAANAALGIGKTYYDTTLATLNITTA